MSAPIGHNLGPITPPSADDALADLKARFPNVDTRLAEFDAALKDYPERLTLKDESTAKALQDLLRQITEQKSYWKADRTREKKPWDTIAKVVMNFFSTAEDKLDAHLETWKPRYQQYLDLKAAESRRLAEEEADRQRAAAEEAAARAAEAAEDQLWAEARKELAEYDERKARERAELEERRRRDAEAAAEAARAEERRLDAERKQREKDERAQIDTGLKAIKVLMKEVRALNILAEAEEANEDEIARLDDILRPAGAMRALLSPIANSMLLTEAENTELTEIREQLTNIRVKALERLDAKERKRRAEAAKRVEEQEAAAAQKRRDERAAQERLEEAARRERQAADAEAAAAKGAEQLAKADVKEARAAGREAHADAKDAGRTVKQASTEADRAENRADRLDRRIDNSTEADHSRTRGELGTVGSLSGRWHYNIDDEAPLRAMCGPLGEHFTADALAGAVFRWMTAHREGFTGERVVTPELPGVVFTWERETRIA